MPSLGFGGQLHIRALSKKWGTDPTAFGAGPEIYNTGSATYSHSLISGSGGSGAGWDPALGEDLGGNLDGDPLYNDTLAGDFALAAGSPAINAGVASALPIGTSTDLAGKPRLVGPGIDMGAYERQGVVPAKALSFGELKRLIGGGR